MIESANDGTSKDADEQSAPDFQQLRGGVGDDSRDGHRPRVEYVDSEGGNQDEKIGRDFIREMKNSEYEE